MVLRARFRALAFRLRLGFGLLLLAPLAPSARAISPPPPAADPAAPYLYEETRQLVRTVEAAAARVEAVGEAAFEEFARPGSRWLNEQRYLFIYAADGTCVFHPVATHLIGRDLREFRDFYGKPVIERITALAARAEPAAADWFFYLWEEGTQFFPMWKSSYVRRAVTPEGRVLLVGSGVYNLRVEREFVRRQVDAAAELLVREGRAAAFAAFHDLSSRFVFINTYIFVLDDKGRALVDPSFPSLEGRDLRGFRDFVGHLVVEEMIQKLRNEDQAWVQYKWPLPGGRTPSRKVAYIRRVRLPDGDVIVGSDFFMASPIWMRM
jgi:signal transduction histidine kinase